MLVLHDHIINHGVPAHSGTYSRETVRLYKNPGDQNINFSEKIGWKDRDGIYSCFTHVAIHPMSTIKRWDRLQRKYVDVSCPALVEEYNEHMGGADLFDMLMSLYRL